MRAKEENIIKIIFFENDMWVDEYGMTRIGEYLGSFTYLFRIKRIKGKESITRLSHYFTDPKGKKYKYQEKLHEYVNGKDHFLGYPRWDEAEKEAMKPFLKREWEVK